VPEPWETIVRQYAPMVVSAAWRILGHAADAEDVAQEVFLEAYRNWNGHTDMQWTGLFKRLAVCRALDRRRRRKLFETAELTEIPSPQAGPMQTAASRESVAILRHAVGDLSLREAEVFCLRYFEDQSPSEIARALAIKPGAVATALSKARAKLQERLKPVLKEELP